MTEKEKYKLKLKTQRVAWQVFRYFNKNRKLLQDEKNQRLYEKAKEITIDFHSEYNENDDREKIEMLILRMARAENAVFNDIDSFKIDADIEGLLLDKKYEY